MDLRIYNKGSNLVVALNGEIDHHSAEYIRQKVDGELMKSTTKNLVLDFSKISFMDSSGIGVIMGRYKTMQKLGGKMALVSPSEQTRRILGMSGLGKFIQMYDSVDNAVNNF